MDKIVTVALDLAGSEIAVGFAGKIVGTALNALVPEKAEDEVADVLRAAADDLHPED